MTAIAIEEQIVYPVIAEDIDSLEDLTPYDIYSTLTIKHSVPAKHVYDLSEALMDTLLDDGAPNRLCITQPPRTAKSSTIT